MSLPLRSSCVGRVPGCAGAYWANLLISSITQVNGDSSGALFDTQNFKFLTTNAVIDQVLQWMEKQVEFGADGGMNRTLSIWNFFLTFDSRFVCQMKSRI